MTPDEKPHARVSILHTECAIALSGSNLPPIIGAVDGLEPETLCLWILLPQRERFFGFALDVLWQSVEELPESFSAARVHSGNLRPLPAFKSARALFAIASSGLLAFLMSAWNCSCVYASQGSDSCLPVSRNSKNLGLPVVIVTACEMITPLSGAKPG